ncbi:MAG: hypothetical protein C0599_05730 [Salinivirgaceae bacterium]|nr:MAG: hypothetical protein C0599_05730 [Salinivirgaceae bacterium]
MKKYDIVIIGGGPAGSSAALSLKNSGLKVALFDKKSFPREKICGDGLCDRAINTLKEISPDYYDEFIKELDPTIISKASLVYKNKQHEFGYGTYGYLVPRLQFDNFMISRVKRDCANVDLYQNSEIVDTNNIDNGFEIKAKNESYFARLVIFAVGAHSSLIRKFTQQPFKKEQYGIAVRAYYKGVTGTKNDRVELHFKKQYIPGYFWIFPMKNGLSNVGFGYHMKYVSKNSDNLKDIMADWISNDLKERFATAEQVTPLKGGMIPYSANSFNCAGDNYLIAGDAAFLADPFTGGGIGNAMFSGRQAALQVKRCFDENYFSLVETKKYEEALKKRMGKEVKRRYNLQVIISRHTWLVNVFLFIIRNSSRFKKLLKSYYN